MAAAMMRAVRRVGQGSLADVALESIAVPAPAEGEVLLRVEAASLNRLDLAAIFGWAPGSTEPPITLGIDPVGVVEDVGPGVTQPRVGDRVIVKPTNGCRSCTWCRRGYDESCVRRTTFGVDRDGGLAEYVIADWRDVRTLAPSVDPVLASALAHSFPIAMQMLVQRAGLEPHDRVVVTGASGAVGAAATQIAALHADVTVAVSRDPTAITLPDPIVLPTIARPETSEEFVAQVRAALGGEPADVVIDPNADPMVWDALPELLGPRGRVVFCGRGPEDVLPLDVFWLYRSRISVLGSAGSSEAAFEASVKLLESGKIVPAVDSVIGLADVPSGYERLEQRRNRGKIVVRP